MELLELHFDTAFSAPNGIQKLRQLILTLAMQGKLVPQDPSDAPASQLYKEIEVEKKRLVKEGKIKASKPLPEIKSTELPYALPVGWEWRRLADVCSYIQRGKGPAYADFSTHQVVSQKCVRWYGLDLEPARFIELESLKKYEPIRFLKSGDLLWNSTGTGTIGRACLVPDKLNESELVADSHVTVVRALLLNTFFLWRWIQSPAVQDGIESAASGTTNQIELNTSTVINHLIPLPPLDEQHRIVSKIDQLMARCDALESLRNERDKKRLATHAAALSQLLDTISNGSADDAWAFITQHFCDLYAVKENVTELRKAILQLAVMGKLVPQDPNDPHASELLKEIEAEKKRLVKEGKIKAPKAMPPVSAEEVPYALPMGWEWVRLNDVLDVRDGTHDTPKYVDRGYPLITSKNIYTGRLSFDDVKYISAEDHQKISDRSKVDVGDILFAMIGSIGNPVIVECDTEFSIKNVALFKCHLVGKPNNQYLHYFLTRAQENIKAISSGAVQSFVSLGFLRAYLLPLPPIAEQHRIVAKIDQLMSLCDKLDQHITARSAKQTELLDAVMARV